MENTNLKFPKNFLWGAAVSSHQVEGGNINTWSEWETQNAARLAKQAKHEWQEWQQRKFPEMFDAKNYISGATCDHYYKFKEDFDIAKSLGLNALRISFEWSRIEPEQGKFNQQEIDHYKEVIQTLRQRGLEPFVTLWHWPLPLWVQKQGGLKNQKIKRYFSEYAKKVARELHGEVKFWITLNEPDLYALNGYLRGIWPPQEKSFYSFLKVFMNLIWAHRAVYTAIKAIDSSAQIGIAKNVLSFEAQPRTILNIFFKKITEFFGSFLFFNKTWFYSDFIGVNYYQHKRIGKKTNIDQSNASDLGWELYPQGIYSVLKNLQRYKKPIYITEHGIADKDDTRRQQFLTETLKNVKKAMDENVDVRGYFHWSLLDNFEWDKGFWPRFGLVEIDYKTFERKIRNSAYYYKDIIQESRG